MPDDYIIRMINMTMPFFASGLLELLHLKESNQYQEMFIALQTNAEDILGMNMNLILHMPSDHLMGILHADVVEGMIKCLMLAELLKESAEMFDAQDNESDCYSCYVKSFNIFFEILYERNDAALETYFPPEEYQKRFAHLAEVADKLMDFQPSADILFKLMNYFEQAQEYSRAEDALFEAIEVADVPEDAIYDGLDFYNRLRLKSDAELITGNLPRSEIEAGWKELREQLEQNGTDVL